MAVSRNQTDQHMTVRTRFAPSPTGYMHIGGMRTALFNWLWARHHNGTFVLRIDDTDQQRNMSEALGPILAAFRWLGLDWDEGPECEGEFGPSFQSQRRSFYDAALQRLLDSGQAYRDFEPAAETQAQREAAERSQQPFVSSRASLQLSQDQIAEQLAAGTPHVVRLLVPRDRHVTITDHVRGEVTWDCGLMPDPVIARNDGSPLYNFATAVDDAAMQISHVIRAEEHLSNTPIQVLIHEALGQTPPQWAHIPYVAAPGGREKISKRKIDKYRKNPQFSRLFEIGDRILGQIGLDATADALSPVMVAWYEKVGFTPAGVLNGLVRTGWSLDDHTELFSVAEMIEQFTLDRVIRSPAGLDPDRLLSFQSHWITQLPEDDRVSGCLPFLHQSGLIEDPSAAEARQLTAAVIALAGDRLQLFGDILSFRELFVSDDDYPADEQAFEKRVLKKSDTVAHLTALLPQLQQAAFEAEALSALLNSFLEQNSLRPGDIFPALRICVTGKGAGPDLFQTLELLGQRRVISRLESALAKARESAGE